MGQVSNLGCKNCTKTFTPTEDVLVCRCGAPLTAEYDFRALAESWRPGALKGAISSMWRYAPVLPSDFTDAVTLQEGWTPLFRTDQLARQCGARDLWLKDESRNPTGSFQARASSMTVTMAKKLGLTKLAAGVHAADAANAVAAYGSRAGMDVHISLPREAPQSTFVECSALGAHVALVGASGVSPRPHDDHGPVDVAALGQTYGLEGAKTLGYEIAEQFDWQLPDAILSPRNAALGQAGMQKAFDELQALGWIGNQRPKMISVEIAARQATVAAERSITSTAISNEEAIDASLTVSRTEGLFIAPESGACVAALKRLLASGHLSRQHRIVLINSASGMKHLERYSTRFSRQAASEQDKLGGLITPR